MSKTGAALLLLIGAGVPVPAAAQARCALDQARCEIVYGEMRDHYLARERDYELYRSMRPYQREMKVIDRSEARLRRRLGELEKSVSDELGRLLLCDSEDRLAASRGQDNRNLRCQ